MWEHLDEAERARRLRRLELAVAYGGTDWEAFPPQDILGALAFQAGDQDRARALWNETYPNLGSGELDDPLTDPSALIEAADTDMESWVAIARNVMAPSELLRKLWDEGGPDETLAEHPSLPVDLLDDIADEEPEILLGAARNVSITSDQFDSQFDFEDTDEWRPFSDLRVTLTGNAAVPDQNLVLPPLDQEWIDTWSDPDDRVFFWEDINIKRAQVAHPGTPLEVLVAHASDITPEIRTVVAANLRTPPEVLRQLAVDTSPAVRAAIQGNPNATDEIRALAALAPQ